MTKEQFRAEFAEILDVSPDELGPETILTGFSTWDSVTYLAVMVMIDDKVGITVRPDAIAGAETFNDILNAVAERLES